MLEKMPGVATLVMLALIGAAVTEKAPFPVDAAAPAAPAALKILPLGDSITYGCGDNCSSYCSAELPCTDCLRNGSYTPCARCSSGYRLPLWTSLAATGKVLPTMIGPLSEGPEGAPPTAVAHAGWPGIQISGAMSPGHTEGLVQAAAMWGPFAAKADAILYVGPRRQCGIGI